MLDPANPAIALVEPIAIHHIALAVRSLEEARPYYEQVLGAHWEGVEEVTDQGVRVAFVRVGDDPHGTRLELLEPLTNDSSVGRFLAKRGPGMHHVAYAVTELERRLADLAEAGVELIDRAPRRGAHHLRVAFLHPRSTGGTLTELCEIALDGK